MCRLQQEKFALLVQLAQQNLFYLHETEIVRKLRQVSKEEASHVSKEEASWIVVDLVHP